MILLSHKSLKIYLSCLLAAKTSSTWLVPVKYSSIPLMVINYHTTYTSFVDFSKGDLGWVRFSPDPWSTFISSNNTQFWYESMIVKRVSNNFLLFTKTEDITITLNINQGFGKMGVSNIAEKNCLWVGKWWSFGLPNTFAPLQLLSCLLGLLLELQQKGRMIRYIRVSEFKKERMKDSTLSIKIYQEGFYCWFKSPERNWRDFISSFHFNHFTIY